LNFTFILLYNSECRIKNEDTIVGFCLFWLRFAIQILISKCLFSTDFRIEFEICDKNYTALPENVSDCELKLERERDQNRLCLYTIANQFVLTKKPWCVIIVTISTILFAMVIPSLITMIIPKRPNPRETVDSPILFFRLLLLLVNGCIFLPGSYFFLFNCHAKSFKKRRIIF